MELGREAIHLNSVHCTLQAYMHYFYEYLPYSYYKPHRTHGITFPSLSSHLFEKGEKQTERGYRHTVVHTIQEIYHTQTWVPKGMKHFTDE